MADSDVVRALKEQAALWEQVFADRARTPLALKRIAAAGERTASALERIAAVVEDPRGQVETTLGMVEQLLRFYLSPGER